MSDTSQLPETADGAIRAWFAAIGSVLVVIGGGMMAEKDAGTRFWIGLCLVLTALPVNLSWVYWKKVKSWLGSGTLAEMNMIATSPRWWFGVLFILLAALIFTPVIQLPRWPSWPFSRTELTTIPTTLRLQFNAVSAKPEEIEAHNIHWTIARYDEQRKQTPDRKWVCDSEPLPSYGGIGTSPPLFGQPHCSYVDIPNYHEVINTILFLTFDRPISAKQLRLNSHGAELPKWDNEALNEKLATIYFHGEMAHMILDLDVLN